MIIFSYQASNNYVFDGFRRNTVVSYQENLEPTRKETKIWFAWNMECYFLYSENRLSVAYTPF